VARAALAFTLGIGKPEKRLRSHKKMVSTMQRQFTLEYWMDDDWYVGKLQEVPGVFSQGETLDELEDNIRDAYALVMEEQLSNSRPESKTKEIQVDAA
jgi:predicted RNase H-like HicB family nuclease